MGDKNNKLIIGLIIFLSICLIGAFTFSYLMISFEDNKINITNNKIDESENSDKQNLKFTQLTKYILDYGETEEVTVNDQKYILKRDNDKLYLNGKELSKGNGQNVYVTDYLLFVSAPSQNIVYVVYDLEGNLLDESNEEYLNLRLENNRLLYEKRKFDPPLEGIKIGDKTIVQRGLSTNTNNSLSKYQDFIKEHENDPLYTTYEIIYEDNKVESKYIEVNMTVKDFFNGNYDNWFILEP